MEAMSLDFEITKFQFDDLYSCYSLNTEKVFDR